MKLYWLYPVVSCETKKSFSPLRDARDVLHPLDKAHGITHGSNNIAFTNRHDYNP
jgi:hypothetical protein